MRAEPVAVDPREGFDDYNSPEAMDALWEKYGWTGAPDYPMIYDRIVRSVPVGSRVLDLACGPGKLLYRLKVQRGCTVQGVDHSAKAALIARERGVPVDVCDILEYLPSTENPYDVVIVTEVLEHMDEPEKVLALCHNFVRTGGLVFVSVPHNTLGPEQEKAHKRTYTIDDLGTLMQAEFDGSLELYIAHKRMLATVGEVDYKSYRERITLPLMLKNEADTVRRTLESAKDLVDEIQVWIDDTTTDNTEEICREYTDWVRHFTWENDFSKIRNMQIAEATGDWILVLDGHEYLEPGARDYLKGIDRVADYVVAVRARVTMDRNRDGQPAFFSKSPRLFRNFWGCHWANPVHNVLRAYYGRVAWVDSFMIQHQRGRARSEERIEQREEMNRPHFLERLEKNPEDTGALFYLGIQHHSERDLEKAREYFERHIGCAKIRIERGQSVINLAQIYHELELFDECRKLLYKHLPDNWDRPEPYLMLAILAEDGEKMEEARHWANVAAHTRTDYNGFFMSYPAHTYLPYEMLARIYDAWGDSEKAVQCARKVLEYKDDPALLKRVVETEEYLNERGRGNGGQVHNDPRDA